MDSDFSNLPLEAQLPSICGDTSFDIFEEKLVAFCTLYDEDDEKLKILKNYFEANPALEKLVDLSGQVSNKNLFLRATKLLSRLNGFGAIIVSHKEGEYVKKLFDILLQDSEKQTVMNGVKVISLLSCEPDFNLYFEDLMNIFLRGPRYLATFANDDEVCGHILASFINSLYKNDNAKMVFMSEGGISVIVESFQLNDIRRKTFQLLTKLFRNLCKIYDRSKLLANQNFLTYLFDISTLFLDDWVIQENILWTLLNLTLNSRHAKGVLNRVGGIQKISNMIRSFPDNELVLNLAFTLFNQVSTRTTTRVAIAKEYGMENILANLYTWEGHHNIQLMCLKVIDVLCTLSLCRKRLIREDRLQILLKWLINHVEDKGFVSSGLNICHKLSISAAETKQALQENSFTLFTTINDVYIDDMDIINITQIAHQNSTETADYDSEDSIEEVPSSDSSSEEDYL